MERAKRRRERRVTTLYVVFEDGPNPRATAGLEQAAGKASDIFDDVVSGQRRMQWLGDSMAAAEAKLLDLLRWCQKRLRGEWAVWLNSA